MKRIIPIATLALSMAITGCSATNTTNDTTTTDTAVETTDTLDDVTPDPIVTQATGTLDADSNPVQVTIDESTGWRGEFAEGAVYLYGPNVDITKENVPATAILMTVEKDVYENHVKDANSRSGTEELNGGLIYNGDDGTSHFVADLGGAYIFIDAPEGADIPTILDAVSFEATK